MKFVDWFRRTALNVFMPVTQTIGSMHLLATHKLVSEGDFSKIKSLAKPGMVIVTRTIGEFSNLFIPGFWTHAAIVYGADGSEDNQIRVVEATRAGVVVTGIARFLFSKDYVMLLEPIFADAQQKVVAANWAFDQVGKPYDWDFLPPEVTASGITTPKSFYCSKLVWAAYLAACGPNVPFTLRTTLGVPTVAPDDLAKAVAKFSHLYSNKT